ncbi:MAG: trimethylamine methyltransferase family protein [Planctomycetota bacterium]
MPQYTLVKDADVPALADAVLDVLKNVGVLCQNAEILDALEKVGAKVDRANQIVKFPKAITQKFVSQLRKERGKPKPDAPQPFPNVGLPVLGGQIAQFVYDHKAKEKRSGTSKDFIELIKLGDVLQDGAVGHCLLLTDVPPMIEPMEAAMLLAEYARKPGKCFAWNVKQVDYLVEMGKILGIDDWFSWGACCYAHPLRFDKDVADKFIPRAFGPSGAGLTAMPVAGVTTPVTTAGFIVVSSAEMLATWIAGRAVNPKAILYGSMWGASMDMKTGAVSYCMFDAMRHAFAMADFMRKWTYMTILVGGGEYCDAKVPGYYAALEKAYKAMTIAAFTGRHPAIGQGMLEQGKTLSPVQLLLEREMSLGIQLWAKQVEVAPETIGMDAICDVGFGLNKSYIEADHTLDHFRSDTWLPPIMDRSGYTGINQEQAVLDRLQQKVDELIAQYQKPAVDPDKLAKMRKVVERAKKELL